MSTGGIKMIDINELRPAVEAAGLNAISVQEVLELLGRLESAESDALEQARLNGIGASREAALMARLEAAEKERDWNAERLEDAIEECAALRAELETERMRLAACGVVALSNTPDSAKQARDMRPEYWSASCGDVASLVDENIKLRAKIEAAEKSDAESIAMYRKARDERDALRAELIDLRNSMTFRTSLIGRIEAEREDLHALIAAVKKQVNAEFRLRMKKEIECNALRAEVGAMKRQEPVAWQARCRPDWGDGTWYAWELCSENYAKDIIRVSVLHNWIYEARALYALPGAKGE
jgi:hypothetical protein